MSEKLVGRLREREKLNDALNSNRSELIAVYGRRRIGKTYLIREFFAKYFVYTFSGLRGANRSDQIENFMIALGRVSDKYKNEKPSNWLQAFDVLRQYIKGIRKSKKKKVIFIDEFPWVDSMRSGFLPAFENFWNTYCTTRSDLIVVVCGSAASYMIKKIIRNRDGLHNRITRKIKLEPFDLKEVEEFLSYKKIKLPKIEILKIYMSFGGVAEYLEHIKAGDSSVTAIDRLCFQKGAHLEYEFDEVFKSLFEEGSYHEQIIQALARGAKKGMTRDELLKEQKLTSGGQFSKSMLELIESGFVEEYQSYTANRKKTLYRIYDEFCLFHLQFIANNKGSRWTQLYNKRDYVTWSGYAFETICYKHVECIKQALRCDQIDSKNYAWRSKKAQIDLVIDRNDNVVNLCEMKFYNDTFYIDADYAMQLRNKETQFQIATKTRKGINTVMVTTFGTSGTHAIGLVSHDITMDCFFR